MSLLQVGDGETKEHSFKLNQLAGNRFCRIYLHLVQDNVILPFQLITEGNLALGNFVSSSQKSL